VNIKRGLQRILVVLGSVYWLAAGFTAVLAYQAAYEARGQFG